MQIKIEGITKITSPLPGSSQSHPSAQVLSLPPTGKILLSTTPMCLGVDSSLIKPPDVSYPGLARFLFTPASKISRRSGANQFTGTRRHRKAMTLQKKQGIGCLWVRAPGAKQVGPASPINESGGANVSEAGPSVGGACVWVAVAALGTEGGIPEAARCPTCSLHFSKPQSPAWSSPAKADRNLPGYQHCHLPWTCSRCCEFSRSCQHESRTAITSGHPGLR